jgi:SAM-dependent methyltransferase
VPEGWTWDETLFLGSAAYYLQGRPPYAPTLAATLRDVLTLDGRQRVLDVGCGPGVLALELAPYVAEVIGVDPDAGMLDEARRRATGMGITNASWLQLRAEEIPGDLGPFRAVTFGQSFHWVDQPLVAAKMREILEPGGAFVHVADVKTPLGERDSLPHPAPPYAEIRALIATWLGSVARAGQGTLPKGSPNTEEPVLASAGFIGPERLHLSDAAPLVRSEDDLVAWVWSLSGSAPHLFGTRRGEFEAELRGVLRQAAADGVFAEWLPDTDVRIWRNPGLAVAAGG